MPHNTMFALHKMCTLPHTPPRTMLTHARFQHVHIFCQLFSHVCSNVPNIFRINKRLMYSNHIRVYHVPTVRFDLPLSRSSRRRPISGVGLPRNASTAQHTSDKCQQTHYARTHLEPIVTAPAIPLATYIVHNVCVMCVFALLTNWR